eukprot:TRINITY_DN23739_c0_g1_i2.p2 TRINITY_DN23739_c0_g1~~TRINITY_DN23739_c0_g1_i2.p2  ORF type:complete len:152 (-),score=6.05 TRINITY_DN23739_c0_g1_i2:347-802(-)
MFLEGQHEKRYQKFYEYYWLLHSTVVVCRQAHLIYRDRVKLGKCKGEDVYTWCLCVENQNRVKIGSNYFLQANFIVHSQINFGSGINQEVIRLIQLLQFLHVFICVVILCICMCIQIRNCNWDDGMQIVYGFQLCLEQQMTAFEWQAMSDV